VVEVPPGGKSAELDPNPNYYHTCTHSRLPEDEPSGSKHVEYTLKLKQFTMVHFVCLYRIIVQTITF
jgi:hypothetical protein